MLLHTMACSWWLCHRGILRCPGVLMWFDPFSPAQSNWIWVKRRTRPAGCRCCRPTSAARTAAGPDCPAACPAAAPCTDDCTYLKFRPGSVTSSDQCSQTVSGGLQSRCCGVADLPAQASAATATAPGLACAPYRGVPARCSSCRCLTCPGRKPSAGWFQGGRAACSSAAAPRAPSPAPANTNSTIVEMGHVPRCMTG